jgi:hypothetical protein
MYLIKWKGYSMAEATWEPIRHLECAVELVEQFEERKMNEAKKRLEVKKLLEKRKLLEAKKSIEAEKQLEAEKRLDAEKNEKAALGPPCRV